MGIFDGLRGGQGELADLQAQYETAAQRAEQDRLAKMEYARQMLNAQPGQIVSAPYQHTSPYQQQLLQQQYAAAQQKAINEFDPNKHEAFTMPLSALVNLWQARYNDAWVDRLQIDDEFYRHAHDRLRRAEKFEVFNDWVRMREDV